MKYFYLFILLFTSIVNAQNLQLTALINFTVKDNSNNNKAIRLYLIDASADLSLNKISDLTNRQEFPFTVMFANAGNYIPFQRSTTLIRSYPESVFPFKTLIEDTLSFVSKKCANESTTSIA